MSDTNRPPLWRVLYDAYDQSTAPDGSLRNWSDHDGYAAEIRAIAKWLQDSDAHFNMGGDAAATALLLLAEADRAEAGT